MSKKWFGKTLDVTIEQNSTGITIGVLQNVTISYSHDAVELDGANTVFREDVKRANVRVNVEAEYAEFDAELGRRIISGDESTEAESITDTSDVALFTVSGEVEAADGSGEKLEVTVDEVDFGEDFPLLDVSHDEWSTQSISGTGKTVSQYEVTTPA